MSSLFSNFMSEGDSAGILGGSAGNTLGSTMGLHNDCCPSLSMKTRLIGFGVCFSVGFLISFLSTISLASLNLTGFAIMFSFGNIVSMASSCFLFGPKRQLANMFASKRIVATLVYLAALIATLVIAFTTKSVPLVILMVVIQLIAMLWYILSYIPYARSAVANGVKGCFSR